MEFSQHLREEPEGSQPYTCAKGHRSSLSLSLSLSLSTPSDCRICLVCLTTLLSDPHSLSHHLSFALSNLSLALRLPCDRIPSAQTTSFIASLRTSHPHLLVAPLVRALSSACDRADDALARQVAEVVIQLAAALDSDTSVVGDFVTRISQMLCLSGSLIRQLHTVSLSLSACVSVIYPLTLRIVDRFILL